MTQESPHTQPHRPQPEPGGPGPHQGAGQEAGGGAGPFAPPAGAEPSPYIAHPQTTPAQPASGGYGHLGRYGYPIVRPGAHAGLAVGAIVLAVGYAALRLVLAVLSIPATAVWVDAADQGLTYGEAEFVAYDIVAILLFPLGIAIFVVGSLWLYKSRKFAEAVNPVFHHRRGAVWAWIGWIVPVVSLWFPYLVVADVRRATIRHRPMAGMGVWWACWLIPLFCDRITANLTGGFLGTEPLTPAVAAYPSVEWLGAVLTGVACWLWVAMIREVTAAQREWEVTPVG